MCLFHQQKQDETARGKLREANYLNNILTTIYSQKHPFITKHAGYWHSYVTFLL